MAYKIQKQQMTVEELELYDESGVKKHTISVRLDRDGLAEKISTRHLELVQAYKNMAEFQKQMQSGEAVAVDAAMEQAGQAVIAMLEAVFGEKDSDTIREFYGNNTLQMCQEILPFITEVVLPKVRKISQKKRKAKIEHFRKQSYF